MPKRRTTHPDAPPEAEVRITWRQWPDGYWEASVADGAGRPPRLVRNRNELEWFLLQVYRRERDNRSIEPDLKED